MTARISIAIVEQTAKACLVKDHRGLLGWMPKTWIGKDGTVKASTFASCNEDYETSREILLADTGKPMPVYSQEFMTLDADNIKGFIEGHIGIKHSQLILLNEYPLRAGWKERIIGKRILTIHYELLVKSTGIYLNNDRLLRCQYDEPRLIQVYLEELGHFN